ncbi:glycosyl transferase [Micromonospora sp. R77]|uniref:macrolide family glycosyltransferase n=1 Tax=Micromonospora sp. R77 TaxID=2925836 RepID=UPI001F613BF4|nr:macrolide family glycosyltransferase [Micromonospora sp. R77]MCI4065649.1 glycosyl transferase [Micromonospora sp. R77]
MSLPDPDQDPPPRHVVWLTFPAFSHLKATLAMVEELLRRGHRVSYLVADRLADVARETGARVVPYRSTFPASLSPPPSATTMLVEFLRESFAPLEAALACAEADPPDLVVHDALASDVAVALGRRYGVPTVRTYAGFGTNGQVPLNGTEPEPESEPVDPTDPRLAELVAELTGRVAAAGAADLFDGGPASGDDAALNISFVTRAFQVRGDTFGDDYLFAGPCLRPADLAGEWSPPAGAGPVLLVSLGTTVNQRPDFFRSCARAFAGTPWHVVMTLGRSTDPAELGPLPPNVEAHRWVPHLAVLRHAAAFVCQGGTGSLMEAMYEGVPVVVVPQQSDQYAIARQVVELGVGRSIRPEALDLDTLRAAVEAVAADPDARRRAQQLGRSVRESGGPVAVADRLAQLLADREPPAPPPPAIVPG